VRSVVYRFQDVDRLARHLADAEDSLLLEVPDDDDVSEGEWVLAIFEVGSGRRATAAAARGVHIDDLPYLSFEPRDFQRICEFVAAARFSGSSSMPAAEALPFPIEVELEDEPEPVTRKSDAPEDTLRSRTAIVITADGVATATVPPPPMSSQGARVLLVDDDPDIREVVSVMLEAVGLVVEVAASAEEALQRASIEHFDLLLLDWSLPGMSGLDLCKAIRKNAETAIVPVLFLSANACSTDMVEAFASGADDYVTKPFRAPELGARIFGLLRRARISLTASGSRPAIGGSP
jgi:two-component system phosphate regulon response regulator PhoB